jgi:DNA replication protein DnaC
LIKKEVQQSSPLRSFVGKLLYAEEPGEVVAEAPAEEEEEPAEGGQGSMRASGVTNVRTTDATSHKSTLLDMRESNVSAQEQGLFEEIQATFHKLGADPWQFQLRVEDGFYAVSSFVEPGGSDKKGANEQERAPRRAQQNIKTVASTNIFTLLFGLVKRCVASHCQGKKITEEKVIMQGVNLCLEAGKMYLVLGAPGSGKSTLLKLISNILLENKQSVVGGEVSLGGVSPGKNIYWSKLVSYIDQIDRLHPYLTVKETLDFAWKCRSGGTHRHVTHGQNEEYEALVKKLDSDGYLVLTIMEALGLTRVKDTFVGDQEKVRG